MNKNSIILLFLVNVIYFFSGIVSFANWDTGSQNYQSHKFSELKNININNIKDLKLGWVYQNGYIPSSSIKINNQLTPIYTGNSIILSSLNNYLISVNPSSGKENCRIKMPSELGTRGINYHKINSDNIIFVPTSNGIYAVNESDCSLNLNIGNKGTFGSNRSVVSPIIAGNKIYIAFLNKIESYEINSNKKLWSFNLENSRVWSGFSYSEKNNSLILVTSNKTNNYNKKINKNYKDYNNSLVILNSDSGKIRCIFQDVQKDNWDLDMVGQPIIIDNNKEELVYAFSKTGNIFIVNIEKCTLKNKNNFKTIYTDIPDSTIVNSEYSETQKVLYNDFRISSTEYDLNKYLESLNNQENIEYIKHSTRNSKSGKEFIPLSINYDVILKGIHGGPEWMGGSFDKINNQIILTVNNYPFIIRTFYQDKLYNKIIEYENKILNIFSLNDKNIEYRSPRSKTETNKDLHEYSFAAEKIYSMYHLAFSGNKIYKKECASCHGVAKQGYYDSEMEGSKYIPSLINIKSTKDYALQDINSFNNVHKYSNLKNKLDSNTLEMVKNFLFNSDKILDKIGIYYIKPQWQLFTDINNLPATNSPWGKIISIDLETEKINWSIPFGSRIDWVNKKNSDSEFKGDMNFGGILSTAGNVFFATGSTDEKIYAFNSSTGEELWSFKMPVAGSSPPMTYYYNNEQYILVNASGGKFYGFNNKKGDYIITFKLK